LFFRKILRVDRARYGFRARRRGKFCHAEILLISPSDVPIAVP
jgi:hypothetical protein